MIALEVSVNGRKLAVAGTEAMVVLSAIVNAVGKLGTKARGTKGHPRGHELFLSLGGLTAPKDGSSAEHLRWGRSAQKALAIGDEVLVRIVRAKVADAPTGRRSADESSANARRKQFEWAKKVYLAERETYEGAPALQPHARRKTRATRRPPTRK